MSEQTGKRRVATGVVAKPPRDKTLTVVSTRLVRHTRYRKYVRRKSVYKVHDARHEARQGDTVEIVESRPISKTKSWRLLRVVARGNVVESEVSA